MALHSPSPAASSPNRLRLTTTAAWCATLVILALCIPTGQGAAIYKPSSVSPLQHGHRAHEDNEIARLFTHGSSSLRRSARELEGSDEDYGSWADYEEEEKDIEDHESHASAEEDADEEGTKTSAGVEDTVHKTEEELKVKTEEKGDGEDHEVEEPASEENADDEYLSWSEEEEEENKGDSTEAVSEHVHEESGGSAGEEKHSEDDEIVEDVDDPSSNEISTDKLKSKPEDGGTASTPDKKTEEGTETEDEEESDDSDHKSDHESERETESETELVSELEHESEPEHESEEIHESDPGKESKWEGESESEHESKPDHESEPEHVLEHENELESVPVHPVEPKPMNDSVETKESAEETGSGSADEDEWEGGEHIDIDAESLNEVEDTSAEEESGEEEESNAEAGEGQASKITEAEGSRDEEREKEGDKVDDAAPLASGKKGGDETLGVEGSGEEEKSEEAEDSWGSEEWGVEEEGGSGGEDEKVPIGVIPHVGDEDKGMKGVEHEREHGRKHVDTEHKKNHESRLDEEHEEDNEEEYHDGHEGKHGAHIGVDDDDHDEEHDGDHDEEHDGGHDEEHKSDHDEEHDDDHDEEHDGDHDEEHVGDHDEEHVGDHDEEHDGDHDEEHDGGHDEEHDGDHDEEHDGDHDEEHDVDHDEDLHAEPAGVAGEEHEDEDEKSDEDGEDHLTTVSSEVEVSKEVHEDSDKESGSGSSGIGTGSDGEEEGSGSEDHGEEVKEAVPPVVHVVHIEHGPPGAEVTGDEEGEPGTNKGDSEGGEMPVGKSDEESEHHAHSGKDKEVATVPSGEKASEESEWPETEEDVEEESDHGASAKAGESGGPKVETSTESSEAGSDSGDHKDNDDMFDSEYDELPDDYSPEERNKTESEEDPFGLNLLPKVVAGISDKVIKGIVGQPKPGTATTQKVPQATADQNLVNSPAKGVDISIRRANVVAQPVPSDKNPLEGEAVPGVGEAATENNEDEQASDSLITWVALGVVVAVFFGVLGYVYVRGRNTTTSNTKETQKNGRGPVVNEGKQAVSRDVEMSLLGEEKSYAPPNFYGGGDYQSIPLEPDEKEVQKVENDTQKKAEEAEPEDKQREETVIDGLIESQASEPLASEPPPLVEEVVPMVKVVATFGETPKPMTPKPVYLNGRGNATTQVGRDVVSNFR